jgi:PhzF family phenazine biosynthesis protein
MKYKIYQVDAFTDKVFGGNPAAVVPLDNWLSDDLLQAIAEENNLSETAYFVKVGNHFHLRWFTPTLEIELCGHATLASAFVLFECLNYSEETIHFETMSGPLYVKKVGQSYSMEFPITNMEVIPLSEAMDKALGFKVLELYESKTKLMAVMQDEATVLAIQPDFRALTDFGKNLIVTAKGEHCDFVSRFFAPVSGINEDPVTGSAHTALTPYWAKVLGKTTLSARQVSKRGGVLTCQLLPNSVVMIGNAKLYLQGEIEW